jgi:dynein light intermediate chain
MTLAAYETIYQSSISYGMRKQVESEVGNDAIEEEYRSLCGLREELEGRRSLLMCKKDLLEKEIRENRAMEGEKREEEVRFLKLQRENMSKFL